MSGSDSSAQVLIVGAGPTGLLLASELERRGVSSLLVDALDAPRGWDRATVVHSRSMEIFEALGLAEPFLDRGVKTRAARFHSGGEVLGELNLALVDSKYPFDLGISEEVTESVLTDHLERSGGSVTRSTKLVELEQGDDSVLVTLERDGEPTQLSVQWVVGCDGLHSVVRDIMGVEFEGRDIAAPWAVFDAAVDGWDDEYDVAAAFLDTPTVILTPLPGRRWRVYQRPESDDADLVEGATQAVRRYKPEIEYVEIENPTRFQCHSRVATTFRSGRVLLAGDAAHACSPAEGHGMNSGLQDAFNLGWKLALVCKGVSSPDLLDSYEQERRPVALRVVESGDAFEAAQTLKDEDRTARDEEIQATFSADSDTAHHEAAGAAELDRSYADSNAVIGDANHGLAPGDRLPDTLVAHPPGEGPRTLQELTHREDHTLLVVGGKEIVDERVLDLVGSLVERHGDSPVVGAVIGLSVEETDSPTSRIDPSVADELGVEELTVLAVRPDQNVGFRRDTRDPQALRAYLEALAVAES